MIKQNTHLYSEQVEERPFPSSGMVDFLEQSNLTNAQFLMWLGQQMSPNVPLYNMVKLFRIEGAVDAACFAAAWQQLLAHSDALRTVIQMVDNVPQRVSENAAHFSLEQVDFRQAADPEAALAAWVAQRKSKALALDSQLFDSALICLADNQYVWYLNQHHLITDGWSTALVYQTMSRYYELARNGRLATATSLPLYEDYIAYERDFRASEAFAEAADYWTEKIAQPTAPQTFYSQKRALSTETHRVTLPLGAERSARIRQAAEADGIRSISQDLSRFSLFSAVLFAYLHCLSGESRLRLGTPFHNRPSQTFKETIGLFIEVSPLQVELNADETFLSLVEKVMDEVYDSLRYAQPGSSSAVSNQAYDVLLNYVNVSYGRFADLPMRSEWVHADHGDGSHALRLQVHDFDDTGEFAIHFDFNTAVYPEPDRQLAIDHFVRVLDSCLADLNQPIAQISLLSPEEYARQLIAFNDTAVARPANQTLLNLIAAQVAATPHAIALTEGALTLTFAELDARANQLAHYLQGEGVRRDELVAICLPRSWRAIVAMLAVLKAGGAYVPIDPAYPAERLRFLLADSNACLLLTDTAVTAFLPTDAPLLHLDADWETAVAHQPASPPETAPQPDDLAYVIYTTGSTGTP